MPTPESLGRQAAPVLSVSIISHGHGESVWTLLRQLALLQQAALRRVFLTLNQPEPELAARVDAGVWPFELVLLQNEGSQSFAANHNRAFANDQHMTPPSTAFALVNPDIDLLDQDPFAALLAALAEQPRAGAAYPRQQDKNGRPQDDRRRFPSPTRLLLRYARRLLGSRQPELPPQADPDWVNAAFLLLRSQVLLELGGLDESYRMYCEDVDLCLRLRQAGWRLVAADSAVVEHVAQRSSHRQWQHFVWHVQSLWRLWRSPAWRARQR